MERFNIRENVGTRLEWVFFTLASKAINNEGLKPTNDGVYEVECRINGVEVSFRALAEELLTQYEAFTRKMACKLIEEMFGDFQTRVQQVHETSLQKIADTLGVDPSHLRW